MTQPLAAGITMNQYEFAKLRDLFTDRFGLYYTDETAYLMERRLLPRLAALGLPSFAAYHAFFESAALDSGLRSRELDEVFELLSTRETYFFRESYQFVALQQELLPRLHRERPHGRRLTLLSAGCASGEEVYSLAIEVLESGLFADWQVEIVGVDLSERALTTARRGVYSPSSFRTPETTLRDRYFQPEGRSYRVAERVQKLCRFVRCNLAAPDWSGVEGGCDAIFCRNLLIYFERHRRQQLVAQLASKLQPTGYLFLGHSESLLDLDTPFVLDRLGGELVYRPGVGRQP